MKRRCALGALAALALPAILPRVASAKPAAVPWPAGKPANAFELDSLGGATVSLASLRGRPLHLGNVAPLLHGKTNMNDFFRWVRENFDASVSWKDLEFIRAQWRGPLLVKGVLDAEDARQAAALGVDGLVVSNHGGRQLDGVPSTARALPLIADAVGERLNLLVDGGVRSGLDVLRLLALGAKTVMLGRPWVFALAAAGESGVAQLLQLIRAELQTAMALTGCTRLADIDRRVLSGAPAA